MGFSSNLQGKIAHEALLSRQDAELRLLESMKRCITLKVKSDRDYATALSSVAAQGLKFDRSDELSGSLVGASWRSMMEEMDNTAKLIRQNADSMESKCLDALNSLYTEKRKARKLYQEEHSRILQQFTHADFDLLISLIGPRISKQITNYRECILAEMRLAITLRFLATGDSYSSLMYLFRVSRPLICKIIPEVCECIIEALKEHVKLSDEVSRKKSEYQKYLELYKLARYKFEEHYLFICEVNTDICLFIIPAGRGGRKLDEVRDKYQKACRKLHLTHNEYVLLLCEAVEFEKDFRTVLLPGLLEHQQSLQEAFISTWKQLLIEIATNSDLTSEKFREVQRKIENSIESIKPSEEYKDFTEKHKSSPTEPVKFTFDESLVEDSAGKLLPNQLTVDNLTVEWLRTKLTDLETSIKENQEKRTALTTNHEGLANGNNTSRKEVNELKCQERKMLKQTELIKSALNELGCEEAPAACDLSIDNQNFISNASEQLN
nr:unnamed protein product [Callosobruchus chinensis]